MASDYQFPQVLREARNRTRFSQSRLAERAGFDHSYVSRLESTVTQSDYQRKPSRGTVYKLARAMQLGVIDTDTLLVAAGYMPDDPGSLVEAEPVVAASCSSSSAIAASKPEVRDDVRNMVGVLLRQARGGCRRCGSRCCREQDRRALPHPALGDVDGDRCQAHRNTFLVDVVPGACSHPSSEEVPR